MYRVYLYEIDRGNTCREIKIYAADCLVSFSSRMKTTSVVSIKNQKSFFLLDSKGTFILLLKALYHSVKVLHILYVGQLITIFKVVYLKYKLRIVSQKRRCNYAYFINYYIFQ